MTIEAVENSSYNFDDILTKKQIEEIIKYFNCTELDWEFVKGEVKAASENEIMGYVGEHLRAILHVKVNDCIKQIHIFIKRMPYANESKCKFIQELNFFKRETEILNFFKKLDEPNEITPWHTQAYICNEGVIVMPDMALEGYKNNNREEAFDLEHMLVAAAALGRFHAATANYETTKFMDTKQPCSILEEYGHILNEVTFIESPWLDSVTNLSVNIIEEFSLKFKNKIHQVQEKLTSLYIQACENLKDTKDSLNVLLHKDLWSNNVMFKYEEGRPVNALLIDYQCVRYGPPAFDLMVLLYMNSCNAFRQQHEEKIINHYFSIFMSSTNNSTKDRLKSLKYDFEEFKKWCENSRMFALLSAIAILPYTVMASDAAQKSLNDPNKFLEYLQGDRSRPVMDHAKESKKFKDRLLEVNEEFIERYVF